jgi:uncharacterized protein (DUF1499 family)
LRLVVVNRQPPYRTFSIKGGEKEAIARLHQILADRDDAKIINASETSIRVEFHTTLRFVDDAIFVLDKTANVNMCDSHPAVDIGIWERTVTAWRRFA